MSALKFIFLDFHGRIDRRTWWAAFVLIHLGIAGFNYELSKLMEDDAPFLDGTWPNLVRLLGDRSGWITAMVFLFPQGAINTKRFHDRGLSGWWWLVFLIPFFVATGILGLAARRPGLPDAARGLGAVDLRLHGDVDIYHAWLLAVEKSKIAIARPEFQSRRFVNPFRPRLC